jgi:hypothetical protein
MPTFAFDENRTPQENVELFYQYLRSVDPELEFILQEAMVELLPLPEAGPERNTKRSRANDMIRGALDSLA